MSKQPSTPSHRRAARIYRLAARALERGEGSPYDTDQIGRACGHFVNGYAPKWDETRDGFIALEEPYNELFLDDKGNRPLGDQAILALCFMAAITERP